MDPRNKDIDLDSLMYAKPNQFTEEDIKQQEGGYIYRYHYNGGGASQVWLGLGRYSNKLACFCFFIYLIYFVHYLDCSFKLN